MVYETNLLDPMWWINSLLGSATILIILMELWVLSFLRKIPNMKIFSMIIIGLNVPLVLFSIFGGNGLSITTGVLVLFIAIFGYIAFSGFSDS